MLLIFDNYFSQLSSSFAILHQIMFSCLFVFVFFQNTAFIFNFTVIHILGYYCHHYFHYLLLSNTPK